MNYTIRYKCRRTGDTIYETTLLDALGAKLRRVNLGAWGLVVPGTIETLNLHTIGRDIRLALKERGVTGL